MFRLLYVYEERIPEDLRNLIRSCIPLNEFELKEITYRATENEWVEKLSWAEGVLFAPGRFLPDTILEKARHIRLMQLWSSGFDKFNVAACERLNIPVANNGGANAHSVAEHAIMMMLAVSRKLPESHVRTIMGNWAGNSHGLDMFLLYGKKVGILGFGNIGRLVAKKLKGFEVQIQYFDVVRAPTTVEHELGVAYVEFDELIKSSDILTLHLHNSPQTLNIIDELTFKMMKDGAILINVSRAQLVNQDALTRALRSKKLTGAGIDVYLEEPTTGEEPLLNLENVVATPHTAGSTYDTYAMVMKRAIENFRRVRNNEMPLGLITGVKR